MLARRFRRAARGTIALENVGHAICAARRFRTVESWRFQTLSPRASEMIVTPVGYSLGMAQRKLPKALADRANNEVYERFRRLVPGLSAYLLDGWDLLEEEPPHRTAAHLVAHVAREIESGVRDAVRGLVGRRSKRENEANGHLKDVEGPNTIDWVSSSATLVRSMFRRWSLGT